MRTTLDIRDDLLQRVKEYAAARSISNGAAVSEVLQRGFEAEIPIVWKHGIPVFSPGPSGAVTAEHVMKLIEEMDSEI
jgi:hypothetical protein